jgi:hypothetical protein
MADAAKATPEQDKPLRRMADAAQATPEQTSRYADGGRG